jgi:hypothetical protein
MFVSTPVTAGSTTVHEAGTPNLFGIEIPSWMNFVIPGSYTVLQAFTPGKDITTQIDTTDIPKTTTLTGTEITNLPSTRTLVGQTTENIPGGTQTTYNYETTGGKITKNIYTTVGGVTTNKTVTETPTPSDFESLQNDLSNRIYSGFGSLLGTSGDDVKNTFAVTKTAFTAMANSNPTLLPLAVGQAEIVQGFDKPVEAGVNAAVGYGMGGAFGIGEEAYTGRLRASGSRRG